MSWPCLLILVLKHTASARLSVHVSCFSNGSPHFVDVYELHRWHLIAWDTREQQNNPSTTSSICTIIFMFPCFLYIIYTSQILWYSLFTNIILKQKYESDDNLRRARTAERRIPKAVEATFPTLTSGTGIRSWSRCVRCMRTIGKDKFWRNEIATRHQQRQYALQRMWRTLQGVLSETSAGGETDDHTADKVASPSWWRSIVVRPPVLPACFPYPALDWQLAV